MADQTTIENGRLRGVELGLQENRDAVKSLEKRFDSYETDQRERNQQIVSELRRVDDHIMAESAKRQESNDKISAEIAALLATRHNPSECPVSIATGKIDVRLQTQEQETAVLKNRVTLGGLVAFALFTGALGWLLNNIRVVADTVSVVAATVK